MWEPVGPLPATVYWQRRAWAVASASIAVLVLVWAIVTPAAGGTAATTSRAAERAAVTSQASAARSSSSSPTSFLLPPTAAPTSAATSAPATSPGTTTSTATSTATSEELRPDDSPRSSAPVAAPVPVPATGPVPCTDAMISVAAEIDPPEHRVGQRPVLRLVVTNVSQQPCVRDLDSARQEIVVWSGDGTTRLWSSNDCVNGSSVDLRTLVPGQPVAFAVAWAGRTSTAGCPGNRTVVPAGSYGVRTRVDGVISPTTPFQRLA